MRDILGWWKADESYLPKLARLSRSVLSIPATAAAANGTLAGRTVEKRRTSLNTSDVVAYVNVSGMDVLF